MINDQESRQQRAQADTHPLGLGFCRSVLYVGTEPPVLAPKTHRSRQKQNQHCVANTPTISTPQPDISIFTRRVQNIFCLFLHETDTVKKNPESCCKEKSAVSREANPCRNCSCTQAVLLLPSWAPNTAGPLGGIHGSAFPYGWRSTELPSP